MSATAWLVTVIFYLWLGRDEASIDPRYRDFVVRSLEKKSMLIAFIRWVRKIWGEKPFFSLEERSMKGFVRHIGTRKKVIFEHSQAALSVGGCRQLVVLGGGMDFLGLWMAQEHSQVQVFELDRAPTQKVKLRFCSSPRPSNLHFLACDFEKDDFIQILKNAGWQPGQETLFIWEGVTMYLDEMHVKALLIKIQQNSSDAKLLFTFMNRRKNGEIQFLGAPDMADRWLARKREPFKWGYPRSELAKFLSFCGWQLKKMWTEAEASGLIAESETIACAQVAPR